MSPYCSIGCLEHGEARHENLCRQLFEFTSKNPKPKPPTGHSFVLGILFEEDGTDVLFVWISYEWDIAQPATGFERPTYMTGDVVGIASIWNFEWEDRTLKLLEDTDERFDGIIPCVGLKFSVSNHVKHHKPYEDITFQDIETVARFRTTKGKLLGRSGADQDNGILGGIPIHQTISGVKIDYNTCTYDEEDYHRYGCYVKDAYNSEIAKKLELPIHYFQDIAQTGDHIFDPGHLVVAPKAEVSITRKDGKPITVRQVEALMKYYRSVSTTGIPHSESWETLFTKSSENQWRHDAQTEASINDRKQGEELKKSICREVFEEYFQNFKKEKIKKGDDSWAEDKSPYEA